MYFVEASERLPDERGTYFVFDKKCGALKISHHNPGSAKSAMVGNPQRYKWVDTDNRYEDIEKQVIELLSITGCPNLISVINKFKPTQPQQT